MKTLIKTTLAILFFSLLFSCGSDSTEENPDEENGECIEFVDVHALVKGATQMFFLNALEGWMIGNNTTGTSELLHTTDGGQSWVIINNDLEFGCCFANFKFHFTDSNHGYVSTIAGNYFYTTDKGATWNAVTPSLSFNDFDFYGMGVNNTNMVFAARTFINGAYEYRLYFVSNTTHTITNYVVLLFPNSDWSLASTEIHFTDTGIINMAVTNSNQKMMAHSEDFGVSWTYTEIEYAATDHSYMEFVNNNVGYLTAQGGSFDSRPFYKTIDGGATWTEKWIDVDNGFPFTNFSFADENNGLATQFLGDDLYKTTDGGDTWSNVSCSNSDIDRNFRIAYPSIDNGIILSNWLDEDDNYMARNRVYFYKGE